MSALPTLLLLDTPCPPPQDVSRLARAEMASSAPVNVELVAVSKNKPIRVLLVDDEEDLIDYVSRRLLREGFTVHALKSGEEAIDAASSHGFDVAVIDLKMPGMDGI